MSDRVDLTRVLALDAVATPGPLRQDSARIADTYVRNHVGLLVGTFQESEDAELFAYYRTVAPEMARTILRLGEKAQEAHINVDTGAAWDVADELRATTGQPDVLEGGGRERRLGAR